MSWYDDILRLSQPIPTVGISADQAASISLNRQAAFGESVGGMIGAFGSLKQGLDTKRAAEFQADQLRSNAGQAQASAQRQAYNEDEKTKLVMSEALARAAASGGGASDPTIVNMMAKTASEGAYRKAVALYMGDERAQQMELEASSREYSGKSAVVNSALAAGTQLYGAKTNLTSRAAQDASLFQKYGMGGPGFMNPYGQG
jgi:hypothetical protein